MKKTLILAVLMCAALTGCGTASAPEPEPVETTAAATDAPTTEPTTTEEPTTSTTEAATEPPTTQAPTEPTTTEAPTDATVSFRLTPDMAELVGEGGTPTDDGLVEYTMDATKHAELLQQLDAQFTEADATIVTDQKYSYVTGIRHDPGFADYYVDISDPEPFMNSMAVMVVVDLRMHAGLYQNVAGVPYSVDIHFLDPAGEEFHTTHYPQDE